MGDIRMFHSTMRIVLVALVSVSACAGPSQPSNAVVVPTVPGATVRASAGPSAESTDPPAVDAGRSDVTDDEGDGPARFRACKADADCIAVPRVGCCHNGRMQAVTGSQKEAYEASFVCPNPHPRCAMYIIRDTREARCAAATGLCTMVAK
jgi:hypothetical protein